MKCPNCSEENLESHLYCSNCGQELTDRTSSMKDFIQHFLGDYFTFDSKIFNSLSPLLFKPGFLTTEFIIGRRVRYIAPLRIYIFISIIFFLLIRWFGAETSTQVEDGTWDEYFGIYLPRLFFALLPLFAFLLWILFSRKKWSYVIHFVFSLHFHAYLFLSGAIYLLISELFEILGLQMVNLFLLGGLSLWWLYYLFRALRRVYQLSIGKISIKYILLLIMYSSILFLSSILVLILSS